MFTLTIILFFIMIMLLILIQFQVVKDYKPVYYYLLDGVAYENELTAGVMKILGRPGFKIKPVLACQLEQESIFKWR